MNDDDRAQAQFTAVKTAYDILGDPVERQAYDRLGHEDYVAKRTSGLPSPDGWRTDDTDSAESGSSGTELHYSETEATSASASSSAGAATAGSSTSSRRASATNAGGSAVNGGAGGASAGAGATEATGSTRSSTSPGAGTASGPGSESAGRATGSDGGTVRETGRSSGTGTRSEARSSAGTNSPIVRWWQRQNVSLPLIWLSVVVYAAGIGHFGLENRAALGAIWDDITAVGVYPSGIWALLSEGRGGLETPTAYVRGLDVVAPPVETAVWYGSMVGVVALTLLAVLATRAVRRERTWGPVTINETIVVALALAATTTLVGGPLLAGRSSCRSCSAS